MRVSGKTKLSLQPWPDYTTDEHILITSDNLLTVCEPTEAVRDAYLKKIGKTMEDFKKEPPKVLLNEDEQIPSEDFNDYDDSYEPDYQEI